MLYFSLLTIRTLSHKFHNTSFIPPIYLSQITTYLDGFQVKRISRIVIFSQKMLFQIITIQNTQPSLVTKNISLLHEKTSTDFQKTAFFNSIIVGSRSCLTFTSETRDDSELLWTMIPPYLYLIKWTPNRASRWKSQTNFFLPSSIWTILLIENQLKTSTSTFALSGW